MRITHNALMAFIARREPNAIGMYRTIDKMAEGAGAEIAAQATVAELRAKQGTPCNVGACRSRADVLELDPTGRLAAMSVLREWARTEDIGRHWVNWYEVYVRTLINQHKAPPLVPMMVEMGGMEVTR